VKVFKLSERVISEAKEEVDVQVVEGEGASMEPETSQCRESLEQGFNTQIVSHSYDIWSRLNLTEGEDNLVSDLEVSQKSRMHMDGKQFHRIFK
jgi:hypothetical protein